MDVILKSIYVNSMAIKNIYNNLQGLGKILLFTTVSEFIILYMLASQIEDQELRICKLEYDNELKGDEKDNTSKGE